MDALNLIAFSLAGWLGFYLIARSPQAHLRLTGYGLLAYSLVLGLEYTTSGEFWERFIWAFKILPPPLWVGAILTVDENLARQRIFLFKLWKWLLLPASLVAALFFITGWNQTSSLWFWISLLIGLSPAIFTLLLLQDMLTILRPRQATGVLLVATLFFTLGEGFLILPLDLINPDWVMLGIGVDLLLLGIAIAWFDAFDEGQTLSYELVRSLALTILVVLIFAGQVGFVIAIQTGLSPVMRILLVTTITTAILVTIFSESLGTLLDQLVFRSAPGLKGARTRLRAEASVLPRLAGVPDLAILEEDTRVRLTRRALSYYGNLPKLAASPLTNLPLIEHRLNKRKAADNTLERASELKGLLTESIARLKPAGTSGFDSSGEWRFYNALYFPYVAGLRPYSRSQERELTPEESDALDWIQAYVPERTLYNWQNAGARLVANDLWELNFPVS